MSVHPIHVGPYTVGAGHPLLLIAGPCVIESEEHCLKLALDLKRIAEELRVHLVFKASFDKANRSSGTSYRGLGIHEGLRILERVAEETGLPVTTDVHEASQAAAVAEVCEILQIPAFLARQTDLLAAAGETGKLNLITRKKDAVDPSNDDQSQVRGEGGKHQDRECDAGALASCRCRLRWRWVN